jgi:mevalonate kinase
MASKTRNKTRNKNVYVISTCEDSERPSICARKAISAISMFVERYINHEFEHNRSVKITIESFDVDGVYAKYIEFNAYANRFETDNYKLSRLLEEAVKRATSNIKSTYIAII